MRSIGQAVGFKVKIFSLGMGQKKRGGWQNCQVLGQNRQRCHPRHARHLQQHLSGDLGINEHNPVSRSSSKS